MTVSYIGRAVFVCVILAAGLLSFFCAGQGPPSGGPPDKTPPEIILTLPEPGALNFRGNKIVLKFSKYINRRTLEESVFMSPSGGEFTFDWGGTDVEISFSDSLRRNTTYIMTVGTDLTDTHSNRMAKAFALPFSTGTQIDSGSISGAVFDDNHAGIMIFAYALDGRNADTLNPSRVKPDYLTQTGKDGTFLLPYLALGTYRLIAVRDEYKNLFYDVQTDKYGMSNSDITLSPGVHSFPALQFRMTAEDTTAPFLSSARATDDSHVLLRFSKPMDPSRCAPGSVSLTDTLTNKTLDVLDISFVGPHFKEAQLLTGRQDSMMAYRVTLHHLADVNGLPIRAGGSGSVFTGSPLPDTSQPALEIVGLKDNARSTERGDSIHFSFSKAVRRAVFESGTAVRDTAGSKIEGAFFWQNSLSASYVPRRVFSYGMDYMLSVRMDSVVDLSGNRHADSLLTVNFRVVEEKFLSSISGKVTDEMPGAAGDIYVSAFSVATREVKPRVQVLKGPGSFSLEELYEGKYLISAFRDSDSNGVFTYGRPFPYAPSERFTVYADTLKLRARWPVEDVHVRLK